jgi:hypothetical protein
VSPEDRILMILFAIGSFKPSWRLLLPVVAMAVAAPMSFGLESGDGTAAAEWNVVPSEIARQEIARQGLGLAEVAPLDVAHDVSQQASPQTAGTPQTPSPSSTEATPARGATPDTEPPGGKRVMGVLPNYRTADASLEGTPLTSKQKFTIASKDSFDYPLVLLAGAFAGLSQLTDGDKSFGQGAKGYAHRLGTWYADEAMGNLFTEGLFPVLFHQDPRYFRKGTGSIKSRTVYALSRVILTQKDGGGLQFNFSEWVGNAASTAIGNAYHPDTRDAYDNSMKLLEQVGTDAISQVLKEFWPDVKRKFFHKN